MDSSARSRAALRPAEYSFERYLRSKTTVDDRALNKDVFAALKGALEARSRPEVAVLEIGAGLGTMLARLVQWGLLRRAEYVLLDLDAELLAGSRRWLAEWARDRRLEIAEGASALTLSGDELELVVRFEQADLSRFGAHERHADRYDLLIANAVLDVVDVPSLLPRLLALLGAGGVFWFTINFDGETIFLPERLEDEAFMRVYHRSMDQRVRDGQPSGDSKTGRHLFREIPRAGGSIIAAGASDWVVCAEGGRYKADEAYFLHHIVRTVGEELHRHADVDTDSLVAWLAARHDEIEAGTLVYLAHQLDFLGQRAPCE